MELIMIRHGKSAGNIRKAYIGSTDEPLCEEGILELRNAIPDRTVRHVFVTDLKRTQQTAAFLFPCAEQEVLADLREMDFGVFENRTAEEMRDDAEYTNWVDTGCLAPCREGESMDSFSDRVRNGLISLVKRLGQDADQAVIVTHGGVIMALMSAYDENGGDFYSYWVRNLDGYRVNMSFDDRGGLVFRDSRIIRMGNGDPDTGEPAPLP